LKKFCLSEIESGFIVHLHSRVPVFHKTSVPTLPQFTESRNITGDMGVHTVTYYVNVYIYRNGFFHMNVNSVINYQVANIQNGKLADV